jgi:allophanate hydrolase subunit 1
MRRSPASPGRWTSRLASRSPRTRSPPVPRCCGSSRQPDSQRPKPGPVALRVALRPRRRGERAAPAQCRSAAGGSRFPAGHPVGVAYRPAGDRYLLVEYGPLVLDLALRFRVQALLEWLAAQQIPGIREMTPGVRSLQIHYEPRQLPQARLLDLLEQAEAELQDLSEAEMPSRIVHLPLAWDDSQTQLATRKYMQSVRADAPWCPRNIEFIRRINGLDSEDEVKRIVYDASYLVMGLGDVYLSAPVATPVDPRHRLVTTKYNPARTWTPENAVGIGGAYMCIYGMEGPGGYQFVGRTLPIWNRYKKTPEFEQPWLLRFFDQIRFFEVSEPELLEMREAFPRGGLRLQIDETRFSLAATTASWPRTGTASTRSRPASARPSRPNAGTGPRPARPSTHPSPTRPRPCPGATASPRASRR